MTISFNNYVNIVSGVGAGAVVPRRDLVARIFTQNPLLSPGSFIQFTSAQEVGTYFGFTSEEYNRAVFYFGWTSKNVTKAQFIQFARWTPTAVPPMIFGNPAQAQSLAIWNTITAGSFILNIGNFTYTVSGLNFSPATALNGVSPAVTVQSILQAGIRSNTASDLYTLATVNYNSSNGTFNLVGGSAISANISVAPATTGTDISMLLGWYPGSVVTRGVQSPGAIWTIGALAEPLTADTLSASAASSNNFGTFCFMPSSALNLVNAISAAQWNEAQNVLFMFCVAISPTNAVSTTGGWLTKDGTGLTLIGGTSANLQGPSGEYHEMPPMMIEAATDYTQPDAVQNYMFQQFNLTPTVTNDTQKALYDSLRCNYYGSTQDAGQFINFYQNGVMLGLPTDPLDENTYANEQWLKDYAGSQVMTLLLALSRVSANDKGRSQVLAILQNVINQAVINGTISADKLLSITQQLYITEITKNPKAWYQVQTIGYYVAVFITPGTDSSGNPIYVMNYLLVYSKDDVIRKVNGRHVLI